MAEQHHVCPWYIGYFLICPARRWLSDPAKVLAPYVRAGMTVLEPGPGMGFFTLELARMAGPSGRVIAVDIQSKMIEKLKRRAARAGLIDRIDARLAEPQSMGLDGVVGAVDFVLAFYMVHELPDAKAFFAEAARAMKLGARMLFAEPARYVRAEQFDTELKDAIAAGLEVADRPSHRGARAVLLRKA